MVEWGGHHGGWGGFGPPSYIVKKCPGAKLTRVVSPVKIIEVKCTLTFTIL